MKRITIIVCGFSLAIALVALPFQYMEHITSGLGLSLAAVLLAWVGILQRKSSQETYKHDVRLYSASTLMKVVDVEESEFESWENQPDGSSRLRREKIYLPTYEYAVNGKKYWYYSRKSVSGKGSWILCSKQAGYHHRKPPGKACVWRIPVFFRCCGLPDFQHSGIYWNDGQLLITKAGRFLLQFPENSIIVITNKCI